MDKLIKSFDNWHKTKLGYAVMGVLELVLAYVLGSRAIDTGSMWQYLLAVILFIGSLHNFYQLIRSVVSKGHGKK